MPSARAVILAAAAGALLLVGAARANEADHTILTLTAKAREQARSGDSEGLATTLGEIISALPGASSDGVAAVSSLNSYLAGASPAQQGQTPAPAAAAAAEPPRPGPAAAASQPVQETPAPPPAPPVSVVEAPRPPAPAVAALPEPGGEPPEPAQPPTGQQRTVAQLPERPSVVSGTAANPAPTLPAPGPVAPAPTTPVPATPAPVASVPAQPAQAPPALAQLAPVPAEAARPAASKALVDALRRSADAALATGDVSAARRYYQRAAEGGCAPCAEALARTYDAEQLRRIGAVGIRPDPQQAEAWRARARQLQQAGSP